MKPKEIESRLGTAPGATLIALAELATRVKREERAKAFDDLSFDLPWLTGKATRAFWEGRSLPGSTGWGVRAMFGQYLGTPKNVHPFAGVGLAAHLGFLMDADLPTEERPIVIVRPERPDEATEVIAPNLREFLGLLAISMGWAISRKATDAEHFVLRKELFGDNPERMNRMEVISNLLCKDIPGVHRPTHPSKVANAHPPVTFTLSVPYADGSRQALVKRDVDRARSAEVSAERLFQLGEFERIVDLARIGMTHPASYARSLYLQARALTRLGREQVAWSAIDELSNAWLHDTPLLPPALHARHAVDKSELVELMHEARYPGAAQTAARVEATGPLPDLEGDFI